MIKPKHITNELPRITWPLHGFRWRSTPVLHMRRERRGGGKASHPRLSRESALPARPGAGPGNRRSIINVNKKTNTTKTIARRQRRLRGGGIPIGKSTILKQLCQIMQNKHRNINLNCTSSTHVSPTPLNPGADWVGAHYSVLIASNRTKKTPSNCSIRLQRYRPCEATRFNRDPSRGIMINSGRLKRSISLQTYRQILTRLFRGRLYYFILLFKSPSARSRSTPAPRPYLVAETYF